jgi:beta-glucosidase
LCGFKRVHVARGKTEKVTIEIPAERLRYWDTDKKQYVVETGQYELLIGAASDDIRGRLSFKVAAKIIPQIALTQNKRTPGELAD